MLLALSWLLRYLTVADLNWSGSAIFEILGGKLFQSIIVLGIYEYLKKQEQGY